jgi:hypothetical protein
MCQTNRFGANCYLRDTNPHYREEVFARSPQSRTLQLSRYGSLDNTI